MDRRNNGILVGKRIRQYSVVGNVFTRILSADGIYEKSVSEKRTVKEKNYGRVYKQN